MPRISMYFAPGFPAKLEYPTLRVVYQTSPRSIREETHGVRPVRRRVRQSGHVKIIKNPYAGSRDSNNQWKGCWARNS